MENRATSALWSRWSRALLGGVGGAVVAQDQPEASELGGSVLLHHTMPYLDLTDYGTIESSAGLTTMRGQVIEGVDVHAPGDTRLRGRAWVITNDDVYLDSQGRSASASPPSTTRTAPGAARTTAT